MQMRSGHSEVIRGVRDERMRPDDRCTVVAVRQALQIHRARTAQLIATQDTSL